MSTDLTKQTARKMMEGLQNKAFSSAELVEAHIARIRELQPTVNAVTHERFEQALAEANQADALRARQSDETPQLLGMPISIKEMYAVQGLPLTGGVRRHKYRMSDNDAEVVRRVRDAGAIVLCKTNTSTLTMTHETDNVLFGRTSHPLDLSRTTGGSSGGEAALISAHGSPWGIGSDVGGSIRLPSHFCGICGIRPTHGLIPTEGEYPTYRHLRHMNSAGPLARNVGDLRRLFEILSRHKVSSDLDGLEAHWLFFVKQAPVEIQMEQQLIAIVQELSRTMPAHQAPETLLDGVVKLWQDIMVSDRGKQTIEEIREGSSFSLALELLRSSFGRSPYHKWILSLILGGRFLGPSRKTVGQFTAAVAQLRARFDSLVGPNGVLLMPVFPWTAPKHGKIANMVYTNQGKKILPYLVFANALGYPAMTVAAGKGRNGLPFGIQIIGGAGRENQVFAVAEQIEAICGG